LPQNNFREEINNTQESSQESWNFDDPPFGAMEDIEIDNVRIVVY
jgi:hypothetical protein